MGIVQQRQIKEHIEREYEGYIDDSDIKTKDPDARKVNTLSRGVAAFALTHLTGISPVDACKNITDGYADGGIDAIYYDKVDRILYLVQSKWNSNDKESIDQGGLDAFITGTRYILNGDFSVFNQKIKGRKGEIDSAITNAVRVVFVIAYSGSAGVSPFLKGRIEDYLRDVDDTGELVGLEILAQNTLHNTIVQGSHMGQVTEVLNLFEWGRVTAPVISYYGQIAASDLAALHDKFGHKIFSRNIRFFVGAAGDVNSGIRQTLEENPELFWYFNNGITIVANSVQRKAVGGATRDHGTFECSNLSIINGAQTVGSISYAVKEGLPGAEYARVPVRIISLEGAPDGFEKRITRTNNTQNRIDSRNFVALDPEQERLKAEFQVDGIDYEYRQGEIASTSALRLDLVEATVALACTNSEVSHTVQAKREIGKLWEDISKAPYKVFFNSGTNADFIWERVLAFRKIDHVIGLAEISTSGRSSQIATHGNRLLFHLVYHRLIKSGSDSALKSVGDTDAASEVFAMIAEIESVIDAKYPDNYLASLFKNASKCRDLKASIAI